MTTSQPARRFFFLLLAATAVLLALVVRPLATPLFLATVLAVVLWPTYCKLTAKLGDRRSVSSGVVVFGVLLLIVVPVAGFSAFLVKEGREAFEFVSTVLRSEGVTGLVQRLPSPLDRWAAEAVERVTAAGEEGGVDGSVVEHVRSGGGKAFLAVGAAARATGSLIFATTMMLIALFFFLLHGEELVAWLDGVVPLRHGQTRELLAEFKNVSYAVVVSAVLTAGVQAFAALIGYVIARVPHPLFFASVTFFVAFIPAIGATSVCLAAAGILALTGHPYMALFLAAWGLAVVALVDNLVKPWLIKIGMKMSGAIVFFALIGGLGAFGAAGLLIGPLAVAFFLALLRIYKRDFKGPASTRSSAG